MKKKIRKKSPSSDSKERIVWRSLETLTPYEHNPRKNDKAVEAVARSIKEFGFKQPIVVDGKGVIIVGHTRWKAATQLGLQQVPVIVAEDLSPTQARAYRIADNQTASLADWDVDLLPLELRELKELHVELDSLGFDDVSLQNYLMVDEPTEELEPIEDTDLKTANAVASEHVRKSDRIICQFSGGKDSTVALNWTRGVCLQLDKPLTAVFVETGAEFPDLTSHIVRVCAKLKIELQFLHPHQNIVAYYYGKKAWPDSIYRDCLHRFINEPVNQLVRTFGDEKVLVVRGGCKTQKTTISGSRCYQEVKDGARTVRLLNPLFAVNKKDYDSAVHGVTSLLWEGYSHGFVRTACWMCPFQTSRQWEALKEYYPLLWEEMRKLVKTLRWKQHENDGYTRSFTRYWNSQT